MKAAQGFDEHLNVARVGVARLVGERVFYHSGHTSDVHEEQVVERGGRHAGEPVEFRSRAQRVRGPGSRVVEGFQAVYVAPHNGPLLGHDVPGPVCAKHVPQKLFDVHRNGLIAAERLTVDLQPLIFEYACERVECVGHPAGAVDLRQQERLYGAGRAPFFSKLVQQELAWRVAQGRTRQ